jgi:hypothetical protein
MATYCTDINIAKGRENRKNLKKKQSGLENTRRIDGWRVVGDDDYHQAVGEPQAEGMMSTAASFSLS